jgi:effector-binding domain-containing protein
VTKVEIKTLDKKSFISIHKRVQTYKMYKFFNESFSKLYHFIGEKNLSNSTNEFFAIYHNVDWNGAGKTGILAFIRMMFIKWDVEVCISVKKKIKNENEIIYREESKKQKTLQAIHTGPYYTVSRTYGEILKFSLKKNLKLEKESFEFYLNDPKKVKKEELKTLIVVPIK